MKLSIAIALLSAAACLRAQTPATVNIVTPTACLTTLDGVPIAGTLTVFAPGKNGGSAPFSSSTPALITTGPVARAITAGQIAGSLILPNPASTSPPGVGYTFTVIDSAARTTTLYANVAVTPDGSDNWSLCNLQAGSYQTAFPSVYFNLKPFVLTTLGSDGPATFNSSTGVLNIPQYTGGPGSGVSSFNTRTGAVAPVTGDYSVGQVTGAAPLASPALTGAPTAPTQTSADNTTKIATDAFVQAAIAGIGTGVTSFNTRTGAVTPASGDYSVGQVTGAAPVASPALTGTPTAPTATPGTSTTQLATTAFMQAAIAAITFPVTSFNSRTGSIAPTSGDYSVGQVTGAAPLASPALTGTPTAPTATPGTSTTQLATTAFMQAAIAAITFPVTSFNSRTGAIAPTSGDYSVGQVTGAAPLASPALTGAPTAPTQLASDNTTKIATDAFVQAAIAGIGTGVTSFNTRTGAVTPASGDYSVGQVTGAAPLASPALTGTPTAPTATPGTSTTQLATTAFMQAAIAAITFPVTSFNSRTGAIAPTSGDYSVGQVTGAAPLASPALTGTPTAPTPATADNTTKIATTAYTEAYIASLNYVGSTGVFTIGHCLEVASTSPLVIQDVGAICGTGSGINQLTGDGTAGPGSGSQAFTLATVSTTSGTCGDSTHICQVTTNAKGLATSQSAVAIGTLNQSTTGNAATATSATSATTATNVAGGAVGSIHYQSGAGATAMLAGNTAATDQVLVSHGTGAAAQAPTLSNAPALSAANMTSFPTLNQSTTGNAATATTAANLSGTPALPNGTTATTQTSSDNTTKLATDAFVQTNVTNMVTATSAATAAKQICLSGGANKTCNYGDFPEHLIIPAANCNNTTAGAGWSIGSGGTATCRAGTNNLGGYIAITDTSTTFAQFAVQIPEDWDTGADPYIRFQLAYPGTDGASAHTIIPAFKVSCAKGDGSTTDDVTFNASHSSSTITLSSATANLFFGSSNVQMNSTDMTGCVAGAMMTVQVGRATDTATSAANFYSVTITMPRLPVNQAN